MNAEMISVPSAKQMVPSPRHGVDWTIAGPLIAVHLLALLAPFTYTRFGLAMFFITYLCTGLGVTAGAHRYFTHRSYEAGSFTQWMLSVFFHLSGQGSLSRWVRDHHIHHSFSDREGDPHSPHAGGGFWHSQLFWLWKKPPTSSENKGLYERYARGLKELPAVRFFSSGLTLLLLHGSFMMLLYACGAFFEKGISTGSLTAGWFTGLSAVVWGVFLRIAMVLHATSAVNSVAHLWGYRNYDTREESRNHWAVAVVSLGEGWHNNHHGRPAAANQGFHRWWEFDLTFVFLLLLGALGLIHQLRVHRRHPASAEIWFARKENKNKPT